MIKCLNCGLEVPQSGGKRHKLYCNGTCKKAYQRKAKLVDNGTQSISGHNETAIKGQVGKCWCCGKDVEPILVCCQECAWSGKAAAKRDGRYPPLLTNRTPRQMEIDLHTLKITEKGAAL